MANENFTWGEERIANALLLELGNALSPRTVRKYMPKRSNHQGPRGDQRWSTFLKNHASGIVACDFCVVVTAWQESGHLMITALSQKIGHLIELKRRIEQQGGVVSENRLGLNPDAPPTGTAMENAVNKAMAQQFNSRSDAFSGLTLFPRNLTWQCDELWCAAMGGLVKMRINTRAPYECQPVVNGANSCEFAVKFLVRTADWMNQGGHPGEALLQGVVGINTAGLRGRANFVQQNGLWQIPAGEWMDILD